MLRTAAEQRHRSRSAVRAPDSGEACTVGPARSQAWPDSVGAKAASSTGSSGCGCTLHHRLHRPRWQDRDRPLPVRRRCPRLQPQRSPRAPRPGTPIAPVRPCRAASAGDPATSARSASGSQPAEHQTYTVRLPTCLCARKCGRISPVSPPRVRLFPRIRPWLRACSRAAAIPAKRRRRRSPARDAAAPAIEPDSRPAVISWSDSSRSRPMRGPGTPGAPGPGGAGIARPTLRPRPHASDLAVADGAAFADPSHRTAAASSG